MKAIVINGSPDLNQGKTAQLLDAFLKGFSAGGGTYEITNTKCMNIKPCKECTANSRFESPGRCLQDDDMNKHYDDLREADAWIFATPSYYNGMSATLKRFLDRLEPLFMFDITDENLHQREQGYLTLISDCSFWEIELFQPVVEHFEAVAHLYNRTFAGALLRPHSYAMDTLKHLDINYDDIFQAAYNSGFEFAEKAVISKKHQDIFSRVLLPKDSSLNEIVDLDEDSL